MDILIAGDFCPHDRVADLIDRGQYEDIFFQVKDETVKADYSIVNLEAPIVEGEGTPIDKCGPNLRCTANALDALQYAGFDCVTLSNNHFNDYGPEGCRKTFECLKEKGIDYVGAGENLPAATQTLYKELQGKKVGFINCCEHEYSIATSDMPGSNPLNVISQYYAIKEAREKADFVVVIVHGGIEHYQLPTPRMQQTYRFFVDAGADAVINHHQHCFSGMETYNGKPIVYGLGNFCFDWKGERNDNWNKGYMVHLCLTEKGISTIPVPYIQSDDNPQVSFLSGEQLDAFLIDKGKLDDIISCQSKLEDAYKDFLSRTDKCYKDLITPWSHRISIGLYHHGLLPRFYPNKKMRILENKLECESHYERVLHMLKNYLKK